MTYSMTCTCGHVMSADGANRDEAVSKMKMMMDQAGVDAHWADHHQNDTNPKPTLEQVHMQIDQMLAEAATAPQAN